MSADTKRYVHFDDSSIVIEGISEFLKGIGCESVGTASSVVAAIGMINQLAESGARVDFALIDGNFTNKTMDGSEGEQIADVVRDKMPNTYVIGLSLQKAPWSDFPNITKNSGPIELGKILANLEPKKTE